MIKVLILDDDVYVGRLHQEYVNAVPGFAALPPVRDLRSARRVLTQEDVGLLLADQVLPDGSGIDLVRESFVDAMVLSAVTDAAVVREALAAGALTYVFKPFEADYLSGLLRRYARLHRRWAQEKLSQQDLDRALRSFYDVTGVATDADGAGSSTAARLLKALQASPEPLTAAQVGEAIGVSRATAQRHLARLAEQQTVTVSLRYGTTGRPEHLYTAVP